MEKIFTKGINFEYVHTQYGTYTKVGINLEKFKENPSYNGWVNFNIKTSKEGKPYGEIYIPKQGA